MKHDVRLLPLLPSGEPQLFARVLEDVARDVVLRALTGTDPQAYPALLDYPEAYSPPPDPDPSPEQEARKATGEPDAPASLAAAATKAPLLVQDPLGLLPGNPALWPEELKQAIARCCCGDEGSSSTPTTPVYPTACCADIPETITVTLSGTLSGIDGSYPLTYTTDPAKLGRVNFGLPGWVSEPIVHPFTCESFGQTITYTSWLGFSTECGVIWRQWNFNGIIEGVSGQMASGVGPCLIVPVSCDPLYILAGMANFTGTRPFLPDCMNQEVNNTCAPPYPGPVAEVTA